MTKITSIVIAFILLLSGCGTLSLETESKMTRNISLKNMKPEKTVYLVESNPHSVDGNIAQLTKSKLLQKGYKFVDTQEKATYVLQINTVDINNYKDEKVGRAAAVTGIASGIVGFAGTRSGSTGAKVGLAGAVVGGILAYAVADGQVRMQVDVLLTEAISGEKISHKTRIIAEAKQIHLSPERGQPILEEKISKQISGIFL